MPANYILLERIELNASAASVTFANIPQSGYTDLKVVMSARADDGSSSFIQAEIRFNGSTGLVYSNRTLRGNGSAAASTSGTSNNSIPLGFLPATGTTANTFSNCEIYIPNYTSAANKSVSVDFVNENNATEAYAYLRAGLYANTAAITSITFDAADFVAGSTFSLYGLAALGTTPVIAPKASGGNRIDFDGTYWYHTFLSSGTFTPQIGLTCDYLVVAGGGGGGAGAGGGGGAGAFRTATSQSLTTTSYTVTIGAGGTGVTGSNVAGNNGSNSVFNALTSTGGGGGGAYASVNGVAGGSGGGAGGAFNGTGGAGTTGGNNGGTSINVANIAAGGGGGAGAVGGTNTNNGASSIGGAGGIGTSTAISGGATTGTGQLVSGIYYFAGGGGGAAYGPSGDGGAGGSGGGGKGALVGTTAGISGTVNTGGGAGGDENGQGKAGGSGIVIIRYLAA